nr:putative pentatricopeptide repeat-containing protein At5g13230, mitochondrial [Tanacetum cinerariifolium]
WSYLYVWNLKNLTLCVRDIIGSTMDFNIYHLQLSSLTIDLVPHNSVELVEFFVRFHREGHVVNAFPFTSVLKLFVNLECGELERYVYGLVVKVGHDENAFVGTALLDAYSSCRVVSMARDVFYCNGIKDMVSWTGMITCYAKNVS